MTDDLSSSHAITPHEPPCSPSFSVSPFSLFFLYTYSGLLFNSGSLSGRFIGGVVDDIEQKWFLVFLLYLHGHGRLLERDDPPRQMPGTRS